MVNHNTFIIFDFLIYWITEHQQHNPNEFGSTFIDQQSDLIDGQQTQEQSNPSQLHLHQHRIQYVQQINVGNYLNVKQQTVNNNPNVAPGWRRQLSDGEIVYIR